MPLVLWAAIAWGGGTAVGLTLLGPHAVATLTLLTALGAALAFAVSWRASRARAGMSVPLPRSLTPAALALIALAGTQLGAELRGEDARCAARALSASAWTLRLREEATPGAFVRSTLESAGCRTPAAIAVRSGRAGAGSLVRVARAEVSSGERGLLLREAHLRLLEAPGPLARWRARVGRALDRRFGSDAPLVRALLIADTRGLSPELRERYADAGLVHILSISGLHVAIVGAALALLFSALRAPPAVARLAAVGVTALYVIAIGAPPPAVRSATLFAVAALAHLGQRPVSPWGSFALGAMVPLVEPRTMLDLGWQLSVAGYAAIVVAPRLARRLSLSIRGDEFEGWRRRLAADLVVGVLASLVTAPLVAWHFGRLSLVAPLSNLLATPIVALLQPALFAAMLIPVPFVADFVADASRPLLRALDLVATLCGDLPGAAIAVAPTRVVALASAAAVVALLVAAWSRHWRRPLTLAFGAIALAALAPGGISSRVARMELHLLDVGQGDAIALRTPRGRWIVVDAGRAWRGGDAGRSLVIPHLRRRGGDVALLILTHPHADHIGGAGSLLRALRPGEVRDAAYREPSAIYRDVLAEAMRVRVRWQRVRVGEVIEVDGVAVEFLAPDSTWTASLSDPNEASTVVRVRFGALRFLLTGDAEAGEERWLLEHAGDGIRAEVLKVAHHGSRTSTTESFLREVAPRIALVSVGAGNLYGHPGADVMRRLLDAGVTILRTDQLGTIVLRTDGRELEVEAAGSRWPLALPDPP